MRATFPENTSPTNGRNTTMRNFTARVAVDEGMHGLQSSAYTPLHPTRANCMQAQYSTQTFQERRSVLREEELIPLLQDIP